jgi:hypothetical protein
MGVGRGFTWHIAWTEFAVPGFQRFRLTCSRIIGSSPKVRKYIWSRGIVLEQVFIDHE